MANNSPHSNALSAEAIGRQMLASLPKDASPQLKNALDAIALSTHGSMLSVGFRLVGLSEDHSLETSAESSQPPNLPKEWNANNGSCSFRYAHSQSSMEYLLKINKMGNKAVIMGMGLGDDRTCSFDVSAQDYVSDGNLPATPASADTNESDAQRALENIFISVGRLSDFGSLMRINIVQKLVPGIRKDGYEESSISTSSPTRRAPPPDREPQDPARDPLRDDRAPPAQPFPLQDPLVHPPRRPMPEPMPGFEDEFETMQPPRGGGIPGPGMPRYGDRDLYPQGLGPHDPLSGGVGPGLGPLGGGVGGGGMHPTFDDPMFAGQGQGRGYDPRNPPGSRYDPTGPGTGGHPRGAGMGGRPPNPFGGFGGGDFI